MKKSLILLMICSLFLTSAMAKKAPADFLDANVAFVYQSMMGTDTEGVDLVQVSGWLKGLGINLVACDDLTGAIEAEKATYDYSKKNVKYIISFSVVSMKYIPCIMVYTPKISSGNKKDLLNYGENRFITKTGGAFSNVFTQLEEEIKDFKKNNPQSNKLAYDSTLISKKIYTEEERKMFEQKEDALSFKWNIPKSLEEKIPGDLKTEKISFLKVSDSGFDGMSEGFVNMKISSGLKDYPYSYKEYKNYNEYNNDPEKSKIKYRLFLSPKTKVYNGASYKTTEKVTSGGNPYTVGEWKVETFRKVQEYIVLYDTQNDIYYKVSEPGFPGDAMRDFNKNFKEAKKK